MCKMSLSILRQGRFYVRVYFHHPAHRRAASYAASSVTSSYSSVVGKTGLARVCAGDGCGSETAGAGERSRLGLAWVLVHMVVHEHLHTPSSPCSPVPVRFFQIPLRAWLRQAPRLLLSAHLVCFRNQPTTQLGRVGSGVRRSTALDVRFIVIQGARTSRSGQHTYI